MTTPNRHEDEESFDLDAEIEFDGKSLGTVGDFLTFGIQVDKEAWEAVKSLPDFFWEGTGETPEEARAHADEGIAEAEEAQRKLDEKRRNA